MKEPFRYIIFHGTCRNMKNALNISINVKFDYLLNVLQAATIVRWHQ